MVTVPCHPYHHHHHHHPPNCQNRHNHHANRSCWWSLFRKIRQARSLHQMPPPCPPLSPFPHRHSLLHLHLHLHLHFPRYLPIASHLHLQYHAPYTVWSNNSSPRCYHLASPSILSLSYALSSVPIQIRHRIASLLAISPRPRPPLLLLLLYFLHLLYLSHHAPRSVGSCQTWISPMVLLPHPQFSQAF